MIPPPPPAAEGASPRKHHHGFTHTFIPSSTITDSRRGTFLAGVASARGQEVMRQAWLRFGPELGAEIVPGDTLEVLAFQHEARLCILFLFPPPVEVGEAHAGLVVAGPVARLDPETLGRAPVRYFVLELAAFGTTLIREWTPNGFSSLGPGPTDPTEFTDAVFSKIFPPPPPVTTPGAGPTKHYNIDQILAQETTKALCDLCGALERAGGLGLPAALNAAEASFLAAFDCWGEIKAEGLNGWLRNHPDPQTLPRACDAFRAVGARRRADALWKVATLFDGSSVPVEAEQYASVIANRAHDGFLEEVEDQLERLEDEEMRQLLRQYVADHLEDFRPQ
jgi:hypothetical protein